MGKAPRMMAIACAMAATASAEPVPHLEAVGTAQIFAPGIASTGYSEIRLTLSPDGRTALWFSRDRPGGAGGYDIWMTRRTAGGWGAAELVSFNSAGRDFDPAFSGDGRFVYFCSDRPGGTGGDDIYRVPIRGGRFADPINLGPRVNSPGDEFAPMLSPDGTTLLFSSDRPGGVGGHDLFTARRSGAGFAAAVPLPGAVNTAANEFDATFLRDGVTIVFAKALDFRTDRVDLYQATRVKARYSAGTRLSDRFNNQSDTYGAMLDWSDPNWLTFSGQRDGATSMDLYRVRYRIEAAGG